jgi:hypothetical protein
MDPHGCLYPAGFGTIHLCYKLTPYMSFHLLHAPIDLILCGLCVYQHRETNTKYQTGLVDFPFTESLSTKSKRKKTPGVVWIVVHGN